MNGSKCLQCGFAFCAAWCPGRANVTLGDWIDEGGCVDAEDPDIFSGPTKDTTEKDVARATCLACPVRERCLGYAVATQQEVGIWAGATKSELRRLAAFGLTRERVREHFESVEQRLNKNRQYGRAAKAARR